MMRQNSSRTPFEPDPGDLVTIRFRTLKNNVSAVYFISGALRQEMKLAESRNGFDYYIYRFQIGEEPVHYYFEVQSGKLTCYYNKLGVTKELQEYYSFGIVPGFHTPGLVQRGGDLPDLCGPFLQRGSKQRCADRRIFLHRG